MLCRLSLSRCYRTHSLDGHKHKNQFLRLAKTIRALRNSGAHTVFVWFYVCSLETPTTKRTEERTHAPPFDLRVSENTKIDTQINSHQVIIDRFRWPEKMNEVPEKPAQSQCGNEWNGARREPRTHPPNNGRKKRKPAKEGADEEKLKSHKLNTRNVNTWCVVWVCVCVCVFVTLLRASIYGHCVYCLYVVRFIWFGSYAMFLLTVVLSTKLDWVRD